MTPARSGKDRDRVVANGLAHKLRNSLNTMRTHIALLQKFTSEVPHERVPRQIGKLEEAVIGVEEIIREFLAFASPCQSEPAEVELPGVVREVLDFVTMDLEQSQVRVVEEYAPRLPRIYVDRNKFKRALLNLFVNARQAMPEGGQLSIRAHPVRGSCVVIEVQDTGCGIAEADHERVFQPFYTTKPNGLGLGLPVVRRTIEDCNGRVSFTSRPGEGTTFRLLLPSVTRARAALDRDKQRQEWLHPVTG